MARFKNKICFLCLSCVLILSCITPVHGAGVVHKEKTYTSTDKEKKYDFDKEIMESGSAFKLLDIAYQVIKEEPETEDRAVRYKKKTKVLKENSNYKPSKTIIENGINYRLEYTSRDEVTSQEEYTQTVTGQTDYYNLEEAQNAPLIKNIRTLNKKTQKWESVQCEQVGMNVLSDGWEDSVINITFVSYDKQYFQWQGILVKKKKKNPLSGYEKQIVESVGRDTDDYKVTDISWDGTAYRNSRGVLCRDAVAKVKRKISHYRVTYKGEIRNSGKKGVVYTSTYSGLQKLETGKTLYTIKATATYKSKTDTTVLAVGLTVGVVLLIVAIIGIIYFLKKKQKVKLN